VQFYKRLFENLNRNPTVYRELVHCLKTEKREYHTYQLKEVKPLRVVIRKLHPSTPLDLIKDELEIRLFEVRQVTNVHHKVNKNRLLTLLCGSGTTIKIKRHFSTIFIFAYWNQN